MTQQPIPQQLKLYILLGILILMSGYFLFVYTQPYVSRFIELYSYRQDLMERLSSKEVKKPILKETDPYRGNPRAKIVIFEYGDFSCEACKSLQPTLQQIIDFYGESNIFLVWKDMPVSPSPLNQQAHQAARCAHEQNAFFPYKQQLYSNQGLFSKELFIQLAKNLQLNTTTFEQCLESSASKNTVTQNFQEGLALGVDGTPTLFVNNVEMISGFTLENIRSIIEKTK